MCQSCNVLLSEQNSRMYQQIPINHNKFHKGFLFRVMYCGFIYIVYSSEVRVLALMALRNSYMMEAVQPAFVVCSMHLIQNVQKRWVYNKAIIT